MILQLKNISKYYEIPGSKQGRVILDDINLEIARGQTVGIVGPSGSGKSTLLNIAGTLDKATAGSVFFEGEDVSAFDENKLSQFRNRHLGFVFQRHLLLPQLSLLENVLLPLIPQKDKHFREAAKVRAHELLGLVGLKDIIKQKPGQMSVGECQRAALVRALINEPELVLADEPTGSLDQQSAEQMGVLLRTINAESGITLVVVTHSERLARQMQVIYSLADGKLSKRS